MQLKASIITSPPSSIQSPSTGLLSTRPDWTETENQPPSNHFKLQTLPDFGHVFCYNRLSRSNYLNINGYIWDGEEVLRQAFGCICSNIINTKSLIYLGKKFLMYWKLLIINQFGYSIPLIVNTHKNNTAVTLITLIGYFFGKIVQ